MPPGVARVVLALMGIVFGAAHFILKGSKEKGAKLPLDLRDALVSEVALVLAIALPIFAIFIK
ncbi:hypothetical protein COU96_01760 [Candidatus Shapirobacteria bacterium CG10_big_fil_rev_8_21_14_0_10_38_14]|uniref:Uncharacterized protein n=1 Tax=Candidatus Shapirobacteria bacterium CG10_big_fil_rev_8_21_14_0_10_38_14 TaxID=1974483 RepID=A0A2M8L5E7_9BACT|nr:MAG: hypothetical protein COU96_01760 [Candidatus Shapirobacteria bacterium CG10_big_fil_rev_8_21_14_0_10_38_14]